METNRTSQRGTGGIRLFSYFFVLLLLVFGTLFFQSLDPQKVHFSNDSPLGIFNSRWMAVPAGFFGLWSDLNMFGFNGGAFGAAPTGFIRMVLGPLWYSKIYAPITLLFLGSCAWLFFRCLKFSPAVCVLGGLAAALNSDFFSVSCWGVGAQSLCFGFNFLALAALTGNSGLRGWIKVALAGMAVGLGVMEAADIGAIFSLYVAVFVMFQALVPDGNRVKQLARGVSRVAVVALFAAFISAQALTVLIGSQIQGVAGASQDAEAKAKRWDWATQWSLPKREALGLIIPGLFGYRMDSPDGGNYWGRVGQDPALDRYFESGAKDSPPAGFMRFTGGGCYAGVLVVLVAVWAAVQSFRRKAPAFFNADRKMIWFWTGVVILSLLFAFGRFAPFYKLLYALPYFSTIRNPTKFIHPVSWALVILFAYGAEGLWRQYMGVASGPYPGLSRQLKNWWAKAGRFDRRWTIGMLAALAFSFLGWLVYSSMRRDLEAYLQTVQFDENMAREIASFSIASVGGFILFLALAVGLVTLILGGVFAGPRAKWGGILIGLLLVVDLGRANRPWIKYWDYREKYATNPIIQILRDKPYEQRVAILPFRFPPQFTLFDQLYRIEWAQHHFPYYDVQSLDVIQMPRMPEDLAAFEGELQFRGAPGTMHLLTRRWELTSTRYLLGPAPFLDVLNQELDPALRRFRIKTNFTIEAKPGVMTATKLEQLTAVPVTNGPYALFEFAGALPRAKLYSSWQVPINDSVAVQALRTNGLSTNDLALLNQVGTNDFLTLKQLASRAFDPQKTVLLARPPAVPDSSGPTNQNAGAVECASYSPTRIVLSAQAETPSVLLLNDKYDANWKVLVDGKPGNLLRCNFLMRGVYLSPGAHTVEFAFKPPYGSIYITLAAMALGVILMAYIVVSCRSNPPNAVASRPAEPKARSGR